MIYNCPYCNKEVGVSAIKLNNTTYWQIRCLPCKFKGEIARSKAIATKTWNDKVAKIVMWEDNYD